MKTLPLHDLDRADHLVWPEDFLQLDLHSPAEQILTDFHRTEPLVINADMHADEAGRLMRQSHVGLKLVVDSHGEFIGLVTREALSEPNLLKRVAAGEPMDELRVRDLMMPRHRVQAMDLDAVSRASVGDVLDTLRHHGQHHCLVVDPEAHHICGLIAASDIARRLSVQVQVEGPPTFADLHQAVMH